MQDLKFAFRQLLKNPGFTAVAVLSLSLGIAANTAIFSIVNAMLFRPLPFCGSDRVVRFTSELESSGPIAVSYPDYLDFRGLTNVFREIAAVGSAQESVFLRTETRVERVRANLITANYFQLLGAEPRPGRAFLPEECTKPGASPVTVLSHDLWQNRFSADPAVIGTTIRLNNQVFTVVGVAPKGFRGDSIRSAPDLWVPVTMTDQIQLDLARGDVDLLATRGQDWLRLLSALQDGIAVEHAAAAVAAMDLQIQRDAKMNGGRRIGVRRLPEANRDELHGFKAIGGFVQSLAVALLVVACANVAGLLLVRAVARRAEMAIRLSLGSDRGRLLRQLLTESSLLAGVAGGLGVLFTWWAMRLLSYWVASLSQGQPQQFAVDLSIDPRVMLFALGLSGMTGLAFGLVPAWCASRVDLAQVLKNTHALPEGSGRKLGLLDLLSLAQVAVTLALLVVGGVFLKSSLQVLRVDLGFDIRQLLAVPVDFAAGGIPAAEQRALAERMLERVRNLPGVMAASLTQYLPCTGSRIGTAGDLGEGAGRVFGADDSKVEPEFFRTAGIPIVQGRGFVPADHDGEPVVIISQALALKLWPDASPLGKTMRIDRRAGTALRKNQLVEGVWVTVVGVARDVGFGLSKLQTTEKHQLYRFSGRSLPPTEYLLVRVEGDPQAFVASLRDAVQSLDSRLASPEPRRYRDFLGPLPLLYHNVTQVMLAIGLGGLVLASVGLYGTISYGTSRRSKEFGIRAALGATRNDLTGLVLWRGLAIAVVGIAFGLAGAFWTTKLTAKFLLGVKSMDPVVVVGICLGVGLTLLFTSLVPARRAARVDPMVALRTE